MRSLKNHLLVLTAMTLSALACKKDNATEPNLPAGTYMTAIIDGGYWNATDIYYTAIGGDTMKFTGSRNPAQGKLKQLQLIVNHYRGIGSYQINDTAAHAIYSENGVDYPSQGGSLTVSADDPTHVTASFQFNAKDNTTGANITISTGQLNINK